MAPNESSAGFSLSYGICEFLGLSTLSFEGPRANIKSPILHMAYLCLLLLKAESFVVFLIIMTENDNTAS